MAANYEKYAVYGVSVKVFLKVFSPQGDSNNERYSRACYVATT